MEFQPSDFKQVNLIDLKVGDEFWFLGSIMSYTIEYIKWFEIQQELIVFTNRRPFIMYKTSQAFIKP